MIFFSYLILIFFYCYFLDHFVKLIFLFIFTTHSKIHFFFIFYVTFDSFILVLLLNLIFFSILSFNIRLIENPNLWFFQIWCLGSNNSGHSFEKLMRVNIDFFLKKLYLAISSYDMGGMFDNIIRVSSTLITRITSLSC
jgi:hypothetical protein